MSTLVACPLDYLHISHLFSFFCPLVYRAKKQLHKLSGRERLGILAAYLALASAAQFAPPQASQKDRQAAAPTQK